MWPFRRKWNSEAIEIPVSEIERDVKLDPIRTAAHKYTLHYVLELCETVPSERLINQTTPLPKLKHLDESNPPDFELFIEYLKYIAGLESKAFTLPTIGQIELYAEGRMGQENGTGLILTRKGGATRSHAPPNRPGQT